VRREFHFLSGLGWSFEDRSSKEVLAVKDRMTVRITFRLQGPSLLSLNLWITPDPATDTEAMKRLTGMADCGPIRFCVLLAVITTTYRADNVDFTPQSIRQLQGDLRSMAAEFQTIADTLSAADVRLFDELAAAANRRNAEYHKNVLLSIVGRALASEWQDKSQKEVKELYAQWLKGKYRPNSGSH
jgi:hypothetical protein